MVKFIFGFLSLMFLPLSSFAQSTLGMSSDLIVVGTSVYFWGYDSARHIKLFTVDEGSDSVRQVMNFLPGMNDTDQVKKYKVVGNALYFSAFESGTGHDKLFKTVAGSKAAPTQISNTAGVGVSDGINFFTASDTTLYFKANNADAVDRLYGADLTTGVVSQISLGCVDAFMVPCSDGPDNITIVGSNVYFSAYDSAGSNNIYLKKPSVAAAKLAYPGGDINNPVEFSVVGSKIFISATDVISGFTKLFVDDGTTTSQIGETHLGGADDPSGFYMSGTDLYYKSTDAGGFNRLYKLETSGTVPVLQTTINAAANDEPTNFNMVGTDLYFTANSDAAGNTKLYKLSSALVRTQITDTATAAYSDNVNVGLAYRNNLFLNSMDPNGFNHGYVYNTVTSTLTKILDRGTGTDSIPMRFLTDGDDVYFSNGLTKRTGAALYHYSITSEDLVELSEYSGMSSQASSIFHASQGQLYYSGGTKNWGSEDLGAGVIGMWSTSLLGALVSGNSAIKESLAPALTGIYVSGNPNPSNYTYLNKILFYDFNASAYSQISDVLGSGVDDQTDGNFVYSAGSSGLYFIASDGITGKHLYYSDGTVSTKLATNTIGDDNLTNAQVIGSSLFFVATDNTGAYNLYQANGTNALIQYPTPLGTFDANKPYLVTASKVYYQGADATAFNKMYSASMDGTGVAIFSDINAGASDAYPAMAAIGDDVYFIENAMGTNILYKYDSGSGMTGVIDSSGQVTDKLYSVNGKLYFNYFDGVDYYLNELTTAGLKTIVSNACGVEMTNITKVNSDIFFIGRNAANSKSALLRYTNARVLSEVAMPDSDTVALDTPMPYADGYLYFMVKSSSGVREYMRYSP